VKRTKVIMLVLMAGILLGVGGYIAADRSRNQGLEVNIPQATETAADLSLKDIRYIETKGDRKEWELTAKSADHFLKDEVTQLQDLHVTFYAQDGRTITVTGDRGYVKGKHMIELHGHVVVITNDGYRVVTHSLCYDGEKRHITTEDSVTIEREGITVKGRGLLVDLNTEKVYLHDAVETVIQG